MKPSSSTAVSHHTGNVAHSLWNQCLLLCSCSLSALWFHNTVALQFGVGVNVFWRHLPADSYDRKDPYGNKDPLAAARALQAIDRALHALDELPAAYRDFYGRRMIQRIQTRTFCDKLSDTDGLWDYVTQQSFHKTRMTRYTQTPSIIRHQSVRYEESLWFNVNKTAVQSDCLKCSLWQGCPT